MPLWISNPRTRPDAKVSVAVSLSKITRSPASGTSDSSRDSRSLLRQYFSPKEKEGLSQNDGSLFNSIVDTTERGSEQAAATTRRLLKAASVIALTDRRFHTPSLRLEASTLESAARRGGPRRPLAEGLGLRLEMRGCISTRQPPRARLHRKPVLLPLPLLQIDLTVTEAGDTRGFTSSAVGCDAGW